MDSAWTHTIDRDDAKIDKQSAEYKRLLKENNVFAKFNADGSVTVTKGGLYERKRQFASVDAFQKESNKRFDALAQHYDKQMKSIKEGKISQIQADVFKRYERDNPRNQALGKMQKDLKKDYMSNKMAKEAANDMKSRLDVVIDNYKKKRKS